jgi:protein-tyrosine phosphatase
VLRWAFSDGLPLPDGLMDTVVPLVSARIVEGPVLIHCQAGLSRSVSTAYALLRRVWGMSHNRALRRVKAHRDFPVPTTLASAREWVHENEIDEAVAGLFRS